MVTSTNTPNSVMGSSPTGCSSRAGSSRSDGQFPIQFATTSSTITPAASQMPSRRTTCSPITTLQPGPEHVLRAGARVLRNTVVGTA